MSLDATTRYGLGACLALVALSACADDRSPVAPLTQPPSPSYHGAPVLHLDVEGGTLVLDVANGTFGTVADGVIATVSHEEMTPLIDAFTSLKETDAFEGSFTYTPPAPGCDESPDDPGNCQINDQRARDDGGGSAAGSPLQSQLLLRTTGFDPHCSVRRKVEYRREAIRVVEDGHGGERTEPERDVTVMDGGVFTCADFAKAIYDAMPSFRRAKHDYRIMLMTLAGLGAISLNEIRTALPGTPPIETIKGVVNRRLAEAPGMLLSYEYFYAMYRIAEMKMSFLAALYNANGCAGRDWGGSTSGSGEPAGTRSYLTVCTYIDHYSSAGVLLYSEKVGCRVELMS